MMLYTLLLLSRRAPAFSPPQRVQRAPLLRGTTTATTLATTTTDVQVFIESTDCFKVAFYANYFKWLEYGLGKRVRAIDGMAYRRPAVLGDLLTVNTTPFEDGSINHAQTISRDGIDIMTVKRASDEEVAPRTVPAPIFGKVRTVMQHTCRHDDLDGRDGGLSLDACLRGFERSRSDFLGGPEDLSLLNEKGISVVVAGVDGLRHVTVSVNEGDRVEFTADVSQVKTRIVFDQYVAVNGAPVCFARISCVCVDVIRGRPVAPPDVVSEKFTSKV